jgi:hypothetical protein
MNFIGRYAAHARSLQGLDSQPRQSIPSRAAREQDGLRRRRSLLAVTLVTLGCALTLAGSALLRAAPAAAGGAHVGLPASPLTLIAIRQALLVASDGVADDHFGISVAVSGDTALVGAHYWWGPSYLNRGAAYVFVRSGATWVQQAKLVTDQLDNAHTNSFGYSVALSGDTAVVGAPQDASVGTGCGSVFVFTRSGTSWSQQAKLKASDGGVGDTFGISLALSGDTAVVGALLAFVDGDVNRGAAYVFARSGTSWSEQAKLTASDGGEGDRFGCSVALSGDTALVGAREDDVGDNQDQGSAYVFARAGSTWIQQAKLSPRDGRTYDHLGKIVSLSGDTAVLGADDVDFTEDDCGGKVYVFTRTGTNWTVQQKLTANAANPFGDSVAVSGDIVLVGGANHEHGYDGRLVYVFKRSDGRWSEHAVIAGGKTNDIGFGNALAIEGGTILIGASYATFDLDRSNQGAAHVFALGVDKTPPTTKAYPATVTRGSKAKLRYRVDDRAPSCGQARVVLRIFKGTQVKKVLRVPYTGACNVKLSYAWRCTLPRGSYTLKVYATDLDGNAQSRVGSARLRVR